MESRLTAIVHAVDGARLIASAHCPENFTAQIAAYVRERCDQVLGPDVAAHVRALLRERRLYAAIALYFDRVGDRSDGERLELRGLWN
jgi:hypothetical protein